MTTTLKGRDAEYYETYKKVIISLIDDLIKKDMIKFWYGTPEDANSVKVVHGSVNTAQRLQKLTDIVDDQNWQDFEKDLAKYGLTDPDIAGIYFDLLVYNMLIQFELLKNMLLKVLHKKVYKQTDTVGKVTAKTKIDGKEPLGKLLDKLEIISPNNGLKQCINNDLRNAIAHFWYWLENVQFYYANNSDLKNPKTLTLAQFLIEFKKQGLLTKCFGEDGIGRIKRFKIGIV